jgi:hypothetical protein
LIGDAVLMAVHRKNLRLLTPTTIENCVVKCGVVIDDVTSNDDSAVKVTEDKGIRTCDSVLLRNNNINNNC